MICECKSKAFYLHLIYKHDIPLKLTIANGLDIHGKQHFHGGYIYLYILLLGYITIGLYIYIGIALFIYCFIACLQHGGLLSLYLYFIFVPYYDLYFLWLWLPSLYHLAFYDAKVWRFCQIPNTRRCLIRLKLFRNAFHKCCTFGFSKKLSTELFGVLTLGNHHLFMHVKRLYDDEMTEW